MIGKVSAFRELMKDFKFNIRDNDQRYWTTKYFERPDMIQLDHHNQLFLNCAGINVSELTYKDGRALFRGANPLLVHANGRDESCVQKLERN